MGLHNVDSLKHIEEIKLLPMNRSNSVFILAVTKGGLPRTVTDVRLIFQGAIKANASGIIVCKYHSSGNLNPGESDTKLTLKIKEAGSIMDIQLLDHLILTMDGSYYSFADNGLL